MVRQLVRSKSTPGSQAALVNHSTVGSRPQQKRNAYIVWGLLVCILILSLFLNATAKHWGQSGETPWSPDSIEGKITVMYLPYLTKMWTHKYPRGQYIVSSLFYNSKLEHWSKNPVPIEMPNGQTGMSALNQPRLYELASITRNISIAMSSGILLAVFLSARKLFKDNIAGLFSALCLALSCLFIFYSKTGCVDIPAFFWFAWAGCFGIYAIKSKNLLFYVLAAFCAAWSVCTKEGVATFNVGLAAAMVTLLIHEKLTNGASFKQSIMGLLNWKILVAAAVGIFVFVTLEGMWSGLEEWHYRSKFWKGVVEGEFKSQGLSVFDLLRSTYRCLFSGWGGPFLVLLGIALVHWLFRYRWQLAFVLLPTLSFFFLTVLVIEQNLPRFMMCGYFGMAILMGKTLADWLRFQKVPQLLRWTVPLLVLVPSLICGIFSNLELKNDTRIRAEQWMRTNAAPRAVVGLAMKNHYAPRVWLDGFRSIQQWNSKGIQTTNGTVQVWPDYLIGSDQWPCHSTQDPEFFKKMFQGQTEYTKQAQFDKLYFRPNAPIWKYCLRFFELHGAVSPRMMVYKK